MKSETVLIAFILFFQSTIAKDIGGLKKGMEIHDKIVACQRKLLTYVDDHLPHDIGVILKQVFFIYLKIFI